ncbi:MAG: dTDP-4-dehydrorhamnose 3,5-epimerase family protein [Pseudomonadota bacterium]
MISGVEFKELVTHADDRGFFREIIRVTDGFFKDGFGQLSHSLVYPAVVKAWHAHKKQTQWNYVVNGLLKVVLCDNRPDSQTYREKMEFLVGDNQNTRVYSFPPGVLHGYQCIGGPANVIYVTSGTYDLQEEIRISCDKLHDVYDWFTVSIR